MIRYILKRLLLFIPTLFVISLLAFIISVKAPGDPVEIYSGAASPQGGSTQSSVSVSIKDSIRAKLGLDRPLFYGSLSTLADCDTLYKVASKKHREILSRLTRTYGNWEAVSTWYLAVTKVYNLQSAFNPDTAFMIGAAGYDSQPVPFTREDVNETHINATNILITLCETPQEELIQLKLDSLAKLYDEQYMFEMKPNLAELNSAFTAMTTNTQTWKIYVPAIHWYGFNNQYHRWLSNLILRGEFGYSYVDKEPITEKIWSKFFISFKLIFFSVILAYLISIPIGVWSAGKSGSFGERSISGLLFLLYSMPSFFVGMMLLFFFANPDYVVWFPESGYMDPSSYDPEWPFWKRWLHEWPYMVLPLVTYTYSSFAFISRIMRTGMLESLGQDYIRTARAKGLNENTVIWKHAFRNSLLPVITIFVNVFPMAIGGSVIIETIFTYPGMGLASYEAIHNYDYPGIVAIFTLSGFLTMVGYLVADILYAIADPRISFTKKMN